MLPARLSLSLSLVKHTPFPLPVPTQHGLQLPHISVQNLALLPWVCPMKIQSKLPFKNPSEFLFCVFFLNKNFQFFSNKIYQQKIQIFQLYDVQLHLISTTVKLAWISSVPLTILSFLRANIPFNNIHFADQITIWRRKNKFSNLGDCFETPISNDTTVKTS